MTPSSYTFDYSDQLGANCFSIDLKEKFPRPYRTIIRNLFSLITIFILSLSLTFLQLSYSLTDDIENGLFLDLLSYITFNIFFGGIFLISIALIYEELHHRSYYYGISEGNLVIVSGIFIKGRSSYPINKITDTYLHRGVIDMFFFLYDLTFSTANEKSDNNGNIPGLSRESAIGLQEYLTRLATEEKNLIRTEQQEKTAQAVAETVGEINQDKEMNEFA